MDSKSTEESADESTKWSGEETEELVSDEEEAETAEGAREARRMMTATAGKLEGSGA